MSYVYSSRRFQPGEMVRVTKGTFAGMEGRIVGADEAESLGRPQMSPSLQGQFHRVMLDIFGREVLVEFEYDQLARNPPT